VDPVNIADSLAQVTAGWTATPEAQPEALATAQKAITSSLLLGLAPTQIHPVATPTPTAAPTATPAPIATSAASPTPAPTADVIEDLTKSIVSTPELSDPSLLAAVQSAATLDPSNPSGLPDYARGMQIQQTVGPFVDTSGLLHIVNILPVTSETSVAIGTSTGVVGVFPVQIGGVLLLHPPSSSELILGSGSVWFAAQALVKALPANAFTGFLISGGTLNATAPFVLQSGVYVLPPGATMTLKATLAPPPAPAGGNSIGQDAEALTVHLPATVTILFTGSGSTGTATIEALDPSSATVYGTSFTLTRSTAAPIALDNNVSILVPCTSSITNFNFASVKSTMFTPSGTAPIAAAGWVLPVALTTVSALGVAAGAGSLFLGLTTGASASWSWHPSANDIIGWQIAVDPTQIIIIVGGQAASTVITTYQLWPEAPPSTRNSSVDFVTPTGFVVTFVSTSGKESLISLGTAIAHLDRPIAADGNRYALSAAATIGIVLDSVGSHLTLFASAAPGTTLQPLALENALVGVTPPFTLIVFGTLSGLSFTEVRVGTIFSARWLLPTLPDPYATSLNSDLANQTATLLYALVRWNQAANLPVALEFILGPATSSAPAPTLTTGGEVSAVGVTATPQYIALLDLSTNVDLFGVALINVDREISVLGSTLDPSAGNTGTPAPKLGIDGLSLAINGATCATFALPQVSWEPMESTATNTVVQAYPASDGPSLLLLAPNQQQLVPLAPLPVLTNTISNVSEGIPFLGNFSLPFGMSAVIEQDNAVPSAKLNSTFNSTFLLGGGEFQLTQPEFPTSLTGGLQLTLKPENPTSASALFPGSTHIDTSGASPGYGVTVLGADGDVATIFKGEFDKGGIKPGVPVRRIDFSGYGASLFSEWSDTTTPGAHVTKVDFDVLRGRTSYEVVQVVSTLYPYGVPIVRTITINRQNTGSVISTDTGWRAAAPGLFTFSTDSNLGDANRVHRGAVAGVYNVRNIRDLTQILSATSAGTTFQFKQVLFDADIGLDHRVDVLQGGSLSSLTDGSGNTVTLVPAADMQGWVLIAPDGKDPDANAMLELFQQTGPITAPFSCIAQVGSLGSKTGTTLRCSAIEVNMANSTLTNPPPPMPAMGVALRSAPILPQDGAWGFGRRPSTGNAPAALPSNFPVPIVQSVLDQTAWHIADIADVLRLANPQTIYGILQDTGTQKLLFEQPHIPLLSSSSPPGSVPGINLPNPPAFADIASLLNATGLFPDIGSAISMLNYPLRQTTPAPDPPEQLQNVGDSLQYTKQISFDPQKPALTLLDLGVLSVALSYCDESKGRFTPSGGTSATAANAPTSLTYTLNPAGSPRWSFDIENLSFMVYVPAFSTTDALLTIIGGLKADDQHAPTLSNLNLVYGSALSSLKSIFSKLQALANFLPGGAGAGLDISLSDGKLTVLDTFALPTLPLGLGELSDISLDVGLTLTLSPLSADFMIGVGDPGNPFNWIVSPLSGNGLIDVGVQGGQPSLTVQGGIGLGLAIDLGIAEGSASITLAVQLTISASTITVIFILNGQASVDVLGGLASASLTLTASVGVSVSPIPVPHLLPLPVHFDSEDITFLASVSVGIHISICWVININFDGSWQFSQSIHTPALSIG
jgi:hypothetical protein